MAGVGQPPEQLLMLQLLVLQGEQQRRRANSRRGRQGLQDEAVMQGLQPLEQVLPQLDEQVLQLEQPVSQPPQLAVWQPVSQPVEQQSVAQLVAQEL